MMTLIPADLLNVQRFAEGIRRDQSYPAMMDDPDLAAHVQCIHAMLTCIEHFTVANSAEAGVIRQLGARMYNAINASFQAISTGYYQIAAGIMRDLLETTNLISYFGDDPSRADAWATADDDTRFKKYRAVDIRKALDERDGFTERNRERHFKELSALGTHPSPKGFQMLCRDGVNVQLGPFFEKGLFHASLHELASLAALAGVNYMKCFSDTSERNIQAYAVALTENYRWVRRFLSPGPAALSAVNDARVAAGFPPLGPEGDA
jgi:hypothetical protein